MSKLVLRRMATLLVAIQMLPVGSALAYNGFGTTYVASVSAQNILNNFNAAEVRLSRDGTKVAYTTSNNGSSPYKVYVKDLISGSLTFASVKGDGTSGEEQSQAYGTSISDDGRFVAFTANYLDSSHPNVGTGIFERDMVTGTTKAISIGFDGNGFNNALSGTTSMSGDGRYIVTTTASTNMISQQEYDYCNQPPAYRCGYNVFLFDALTNQAFRITGNDDGTPLGGSSSNVAIAPRISQNGRYVTYLRQTLSHDYSYDMYKWDRVTGETVRVCDDDAGASSCGPNTSDGGSNVTNDGRVFYGKAPYDVLRNTPGDFTMMMWEPITQTSQPLQAMNGGPVLATFMNVSSGGRFAVYTSPRSSEVYLLDTLGGAVRDVSLDSYGNQTPTFKGGPSVSDDGAKVAFASSDDSLVPGVSNGISQVYIHDFADFAQPPMPIVDQTAPLLGSLGWSANPLAKGANTTLSVPVTDAVSGVARVEYYVDNDPGLGNGIPMSLAGSKYQVTFGAGLAAGTYAIGVRALDAAGNWSAVSMDVLAVYDAAGGYVTGHASIAPSASDVLPITERGSKDLVLGFSNVKYGSTTTSPSGSLDLNYVVKNNKDEFGLSSTALDWLVVPDATHAIIQGTGLLTVYVDGVKSVTAHPFRVEVVLGVNGARDHVVVKIFAVGANPATAAPQYVIDDDADSSTVRVK